MSLNEFNIKPVHDKFLSVDNDSTYTSLSSNYNLSDKAFKDFVTVDTDSTYTSLKTSGYQIVEVPPPVLLSELGVSADSLFVKVTKYFEELGVHRDDGFFGHFNLEELGSGTDSLHVKVTKYFEELGQGTDFQVSSKGFEDVSHGADFLVVKLIKHFTELGSGADSIEAYQAVDSKDTLSIKVTKAVSYIDSMRISVDGFVNSSDSINIINVPYSLPAVTDETSGSNPLEPTVILVDDASGSNTVVSNVSTAPSFTPTSTYINILNMGIANRNLCNFHGTGFNIDYDGGSFTISSRDPLASSASVRSNLGLEFTAFGLKATTSDFGENMSNSEVLYETAGIFGNKNLHKPFNIITYQSKEYLQFIGSTQLFTLPTNREGTITSASDMARAVGTAAGVTISWLVPDIPYKDTLSQNGLTGLEALSSLASQVGATLRWNGNTHYIIAYPNYHAGTWRIRDQRLIRSITYKHHLDLGLGVTGSGVLGIPVNQFYDISQRQLFNQVSQTREVFRHGPSISNKPTSSDPPVIFDLPNDVGNVVFQFLIGTTNEDTDFAEFGGIGTGGTGITTNPDNWTSLPPGFIQIGNFYRQGKRAVIPYTFFPDHPKVNKGNFSLNFGIERISSEVLWRKSELEVEEARRELLARIKSNNRFIRTFSATIVCDFYGAVPLPGMFVDFNFCGRSITGIIESVSVTDMNSLTVEIAQYLRVNFLDRKMEQDYNQGNYFTDGSVGASP